MTEEKKAKRTLSNTPASDWGPMDDNKAINALLNVFKKLPEKRKQVVLSGFLAYAGQVKEPAVGASSPPEAWGK